MAPAELESFLLDHPIVHDCGVFGVPDERAGELVRAVIVTNAEAIEPGTSQDAIAKTLTEYVQKGKARHKWLSGGVEVVDVVPKSPSGKILRRELRSREVGRRKAARAKL